MLRRGAALCLAGWVLGLAGSAAGDGADAEPAPAPPVVWVALGGETFTLEVAADRESRFRGLSGRDSIGRSAGMLFIYPDDAPRGMVMRDCPVPIDVAFLDASGRVVSLHAMPVEPPRQPGESRMAYERRLPIFRSQVPARFAIELAGGRLAQLGVTVGDRVALDTGTLSGWAR
ncbi:MAG: DUF192 domain-containing protein [Myxococcota bacterium]|nr:DUF192 domain-containing protein [Myxococcota bacterium]